MSDLFYAVGSSYCFLAVPFAPDTVDISGLCGGGKQPVTDNTLCEIRWSIILAQLFACEQDCM